MYSPPLHLSAGVVEDGVVRQQVQHPGAQRLEALEASAQVTQEADQRLGGVMNM